MQLAPLATAPVPGTAPTTAGSPFGGTDIHIASGHWMAPHGLPKYTAGWWTAGADLAPNDGWTSREAALEGARLLSTKSSGPIAVTMAFDGPDDGNMRYHAHRIATSELVEGDNGWNRRPDQWLTSDMIRRPQFQGWSMMSFALVGIADRGAELQAGTGS